jgi:hypothetical protein
MRNLIFVGAALAALTSPALAAIDALKNIQGVWGWRADFLQSCSENPQTIQVAPDGKTLTMRYAKPYTQGSVTVTELTFDIVSVKPRSLVLLRTDAPAVGKPTPVDVLFLDENTMSWSPSKSMLSSGAIGRCAPARQ